MCEPPSVYSIHIIKKSKKEHKCIECKKIIPIDSSYEIIKGLWDGKWSKYKTCLKCVEVREEEYKITKEPMPIGRLFENCLPEDLPEHARTEL